MIVSVPAGGLVIPFRTVGPTTNLCQSTGSSEEKAIQSYDSLFSSHMPAIKVLPPKALGRKGLSVSQKQQQEAGETDHFPSMLRKRAIVYAATEFLFSLYTVQNPQWGGVPTSVNIIKIPSPHHIHSPTLPMLKSLASR